MVLTGHEIVNRLGNDIVIEPFNMDQLNPNSYNLRLDNKLLTYEHRLDTRKANIYRPITIPDDGLQLDAGNLYLGGTIERTETYNLVPMIEGRSSIGRLGLFVHVTAGFGDIGFRGYWTLELIPMKDIIIYPGLAICQIFYHTITGKVSNYEGKYQDNEGVQSSKIYEEKM